MYDKIDIANPTVSFKNSNYYKQKRHLGGLMSQQSLSKLKNQIKGMAEHRRECYDLSSNPEV